MYDIIIYLQVGLPSILTPFCNAVIRNLIFKIFKYLLKVHNKFKFLSFILLLKGADPSIPVEIQTSVFQNENPPHSSVSYLANNFSDL